jgi:PAS domain S-box-containing protein
MKKKILVVDNHPVMLKFMNNLLEKEGHQVLTAEDGLSALDILKTYIPDVIFIDLVMPHINGEKLCWIIRKMPRMKNVYLIILSAIAAEESTDFAEFGANACIAKGPFNEMAKHVLAVLDQLDLDASSTFSEKIIGLQDIHKRQITEELLSSKRHSEAILGNMTEGILELTLEGKIIYANPAAVSLTGILEDKLLASNFTELFSKPHSDRIKDLMAMIGDKPQAISEDSPVVLNGKPVSINIVPVKEEEHESIIVIMNDITGRKKAEEALINERDKLQDALAKVKTLSGMLPICSNCKKIRDDKGYWNQIESYIAKHTEVDFSHSICPECAKKLYPDYYKGD